MKLLVHADDVGYCRERDQGIFRCVESGVIKNVSFLVTFRCKEDTVTKCKELMDSRGLVVGLHINLTEGTPISDDIPSLIDKNGDMKGKMGFRESWECGDICREDVEKEIHAQCRVFHELFGCYPSHVDSHQHIHQINGITEIITSIVREYGVKSIRRQCVSVWNEPANGTSEFLHQVFKQSRHCISMYDKDGLYYADAMIGLNFMGNGREDTIVNAILEVYNSCGENINLDNYYIEWMCHPGYINHSTDDFSASVEREKEMELIVSADNIIRTLQEVHSISISFASWFDLHNERTNSNKSK